MAFGLGGKDIVQIIISAKDTTAAAFNKVQRRLGKLENIAARVRGTIGKVAKATALIGGVAAIGAVVAGTKVFMAFEQSIANTASVSGATGEELKKLEDAAREMGKTTAFSASQAAEAMYFLGSAGYDTEQIIGSLNGVMKLAGATQSDLASTSETVVSTLNAFGLEAKDSDRIANVFAATIANSQATMDKLAYSMRYIGPVAHELGWSIEETTGALGQLYNAGFKGEQAGTILRGSMTRLLDPSAETTKVLAAYGLTVDDVNPKTRSLSEIIGTLKGVGLDTADAMRIFGQEAGPGMMSLLGKGSEAIDELTAKVTGTNAATEMYETQMNTLKGTLMILKSALEEVGIVLGKAIAPYLTTIANKFKDSLPVIMEYASKLKDELQPTFESLKNIFSSAIKILKQIFTPEDKDKISTFADAVNKITGFVEKLFKFLEKHPGLVNFGLAIGTVVVAISYAIPIIQSLITSIAAIKTAMIALNVFMAANPIVLILMAIVVAIGLLYYAWTHNWGGIQDKVKAVITFLIPAFEWIKNKLNAIKKYLPLLLGPIGAVYLAFKNWDKIKEVATKLKDAISDKFSAMKDKISDFTSKVQDKLGLTKRELLMMASPAGPIVLFKKAWDKNLFGIQDKVREAMDVVKEKISNAVSTIREKIESISDLPGKAFQWGKDLIQSFIDGIGAMIRKLKEKIEEAISFIPDFMKPGSGTKLGPLRTLDEWGPKLIKTFAEGIEKGLPELNATFKTMAIPFETTSIAGSSSSSKTYVTHIHIGSVDSQETADYFIDKIERVMKKGAVI